MERNISAFQSDSLRYGGYVYTAVDRWSSRVATSRQTDELVRMVAGHFPRTVRITDIGCGDGALTMEFLKLFQPSCVRGVDPAISSIDAARRRLLSNQAASVVSFEVGNIYDIENIDRDCEQPSLAVVRGVLHHLDNPRAAIARLAQQFDWVLVLEPNGFNPVMKAIERLSTYHRNHDEKSYWPPALNRWFSECGFSVLEQKFFCLVPYFCPTPIARCLKALEPVVEIIPMVREIGCGTNLILYKRAN